MNTKLRGAVLALLTLPCASPAFAQTDSATDEIVASGFRADAVGPAGTMGDHVHESGNVMVGVTWTRERYSGANHRGTNKATDAQVAAAGYTVRASEMTMDMVMLHLMYAPSDRITLMVMPMWMRMDMEMTGIAMPAGGHDGHGGHSLMPGQTMSHAVSGVSDTRASALVSLSRDPKLSAHAGLTVSIPTGSVSRKNDAGQFVHYGMQSGSGTWDLEPSFTLRGGSEALSWGLQASYLHRLEDRNDSGFRFGDRFSATGWLARPLSRNISLSARLAYTDEGIIKGHYNGAHNHSSPPDRQENYGGKRLEAGLGINTAIGKGLRLGAEATVPLYQKVNGYQLTKDYGLNLNISQMF